MPSKIANTKSIPFNGEMVRAILDERKTEMRRPIKPQPVVKHRSAMACSLAEKLTDGVLDAKRLYDGLPDGPVLTHPEHGGLMPCPYGEPGDLLYVRESMNAGVAGEPEVLVYIADGALRGPQNEGERRWVWRKAVGQVIRATHMPRWASRITLRVSKVRVERVQDITREGVHAEGTPGMVAGKYQCRECNGSGWTLSYPQDCIYCEPKGSGLNHTRDFRSLWDSINEKRGYGWDANPWVWVVTWDRMWRENVDEVPKDKGVKT